MATSLDHGFTKVICLNENSRLNRAVFSSFLAGRMEYGKDPIIIEAA